MPNSNDVDIRLNDLIASLKQQRAKEQTIMSTSKNDIAGITDYLNGLGIGCSSCLADRDGSKSPCFGCLFNKELHIGWVGTRYREDFEERVLYRTPSSTQERLLTLPNKSEASPDEKDNI